MKNHELRIKLTQEQLTKVKHKAKELGISVSDFVRILITRSKINVES